LAHELDCAESTVDEMVKRGVLPKPLHLSSGCVRWCWADVVMALGSLKAGPTSIENDPHLTGAKNVTEVAARNR
jgi:predicted DNA-binding transcriptional regulator AlpA